MATQPMTIERRGPGTLARLRGKIDLEIVERLDRESRGSSPLLVDLAGVQYVSSSGLAGFAKLSTERDLRLVALPAMVRQVIGLAGLDRILAIYEDEKLKVKGQGMVELRSIKKREIAALITHAGRLPVFVDSDDDAPRTRGPAPEVTQNVAS